MYSIKALVTWAEDVPKAQTCDFTLYKERSNLAHDSQPRH